MNSTAKMFVALRKFQFSNSRSSRFLGSSVSVESLIKSGVLSLKDEVKYALNHQQPVVALESTIITHGLPYPENVKCAIDVEDEVRKWGAIPATIAIVNGVIKAGLTHDEIENLGNTIESNPVKTSRRDFPFILSKRMNGGTTVSGTLIVADKMNIPIFATGGIGGVHREGETTFDISADLTELGKSQVAVVSSGVKSILDIPKTLEYLETQGVFVASYGSTTDFPAFYTRRSGCQAPYSISSPTEAARVILCSKSMNMKSGMLLAAPVPEEYALNDEEIRIAIEEALGEARKNNVQGKQITPFLLRKIWEITQGKSLYTNVALIKNNASIAAQIAVELEKLKESDKLRRKSESTRKSNNDGIVVIGGSNMDICARVKEGEIKLDGKMHPSKLTYVPGGVGRNICEALFKLGANPTFITAIGDDESGNLLVSMMPKDVAKFTRTISGRSTAQCLIVLDSQGNCSCLLADFDIHKEISPRMITEQKEMISRSKLIILDGNLCVESIEVVLKLATKYDIPVFFEPTDVIVSAKPFETKYARAVKIITPNKNELLYIASKMGFSTRHVIENEHLEISEISTVAGKVAQFVDIVIVTLGAQGVLVARRADASQSFLNCVENSERIQLRHYPAELIDGIVNVNGAGDSFASGLIVAMMKDLPEENCICVGLTAAKLTLKSSSSVAEQLFNEYHSCWKNKAEYNVIN